MSDEFTVEFEDEGPEVEFEVETILSDEQKDEIFAWLDAEIRSVDEGSTRKGYLEDVRKWRRQREARPAQKEKSYPWPKASNVVPPIAMMNTNGIYALLKTSFSVRKPFFTVRPANALYRDQAKAAELMLSALVESPQHVNLRKENNTILYELASMGTEVVKVPWVFDQRMFKVREAGGAYRTVTQTVKDSPAVMPIRAEDFLIQPYWNNLQRAPWIAHRIHLMEHELMQRQALGIYDGVDEVIASGSDEVDEGRKEVLERSGFQQSSTADSKMYSVDEVYFYWDVDGDGIPEDVIAWIHRESGTWLRVEYNDLGVRPFVGLGYLQRPHEFYAIGVGWMSESMQDEIEALHNMRIDGTHIASLQMYVTRRGGGVSPNEKFRPLKNIAVDNPRDDFLPIKFPDISGGTVQAEMMAKEYADRATGASDAMMGFENPATSSRTTATGTIFLAQQGSKMFNAVQESVEDGYGEMGLILLYQVVRNRERATELKALIDPEYHAAFDELLEVPLEEIPTRFQFSVQTTEPEKTEDAKRQNVLTLTQLYSVYIEKMMQLAMMMENPQLPPKVKEMLTNFYVGQTKLMEKTLGMFEEGLDEDAYLPYVKDLEMMIEHIEAMKDRQVEAVKNVQGNGQRMGIEGAGGAVPGGAAPAGRAPQGAQMGGGPGPTQRPQ